MTTVQGITKGVLYFFFGILFMIVTYYTIPILANEFQTPFIKALFYMSLITIYIIQILVIPIMLIMDKLDIDIRQLIKGVTWFIAGIFYTLISWQIVPPLIEALNSSLTRSVLLSGIMHTGLIVTYILALLVVPNFFIFTGTEKDETTK